MNEMAQRETRSYLFGWNPNLWPWDNIEQDRGKVASGNPVEYKWQCSNRQMKPGDIAYIIRYGTGIEPKGVVASGRITSPPFLVEPDYRLEPDVQVAPPEPTWHVSISLDEIKSETDLLLLAELSKAAPRQVWNPRGSGIAIKRDAADVLSRLWRLENSN